MNQQRVSLAFLALVGLLVLSPATRSNPGDRGNQRPSGGQNERPSGGGSSRPAPQPAPSRPAPQPAPSRPAPQPAPSRPAPQSAPSRPAPAPTSERPVSRPPPSRPVDVRPSAPPVVRERPAPVSRPSDAPPPVRERTAPQPRDERPAPNAGGRASERAPRYVPDAGSNGATRPRVYERGETNVRPDAGGRPPSERTGGDDSARSQPGSSGSFDRPSGEPFVGPRRDPAGNREGSGRAPAGARGDASPGRRVFDDERVPASDTRPRGRVFDESRPIDLSGAALPPRARVPSLSGSTAGERPPPSGRGERADTERPSLGWRRLEAIDKAAKDGAARPLPTPIGGSIDTDRLADRYRERGGLAQPRDERPGRTGGGGLESGRGDSAERGPVLSDLRRNRTKGDRESAPPIVRTPDRSADRPRDTRPAPSAPVQPAPRSRRAGPGAPSVGGDAIASRTERLRELARSRPTQWTSVTTSGVSVSHATSLGLTLGFNTAAHCFGGNAFWSPYYSGHHGHHGGWNHRSSWSGWYSSWCWSAPAFCWPGYGWGFSYWARHGGFSFGYNPFWNHCSYAYPVYYSGVIYDTYDPPVVVREVPVYVEVPAPEPAEAAAPAAHGEGVIEVPRGAAPDAAAERDGAANTTATVYLDKGDLAWREGRYADAVHFYAKAVEYAPDEGVLHLILADALFSTGDYHYAAFSLRKALELDPGLLTSTLDKHDLYPDPRAFDEQLAVLEQYVADHPIDDDARLLLAANYLFGRRPAQSADVLESPYAVALRDTVIGKLVLDRARELRENR